MLNFLVYIGSYASGAQDGIHVHQLDMSNGALIAQSSIGGIANPSFLAISPDHRHLYAIGEVSEVNGQSGGAVAAFAIDQQSGALSHINTESSVGAGPCHISIDHTGCHAFVANYGGGSVAVLPINEDGSLGPASDFSQHEGSSVDPARQKEPHAHSFFVSPNNRYALAPDLGLDQIKVYAIDHQTGKLTEQEPGRVEPGQGPRHLDFHPDNGHLYVINEMGNTITVFDFDQEAGTLTAGQTISTLPEGEERDNLDKQFEMLAVQIAESVKRRVKGLHQITFLGSGRSRAVRASSMRSGRQRRLPSGRRSCWASSAVCEWAQTK